MITTFEEACEFVLKHKVCTVFGSKGSPDPSLWDNTDLSEEKPPEGGWPPKVIAVWDWKTRIPQTFPDEIYYGEVPGGDAVLMEMRHLRSKHYPKAYQSVSELDDLSLKIYECIRIEPWLTGPLRKHCIAELGCTNSRFDSALKKLQISLNIVRSNDPSLKNDQWLPFTDVHLDIVEREPYKFPTFLLSQYLFLSSHAQLPTRLSCRKLRRCPQTLGLGRMYRIPKAKG